MTEPQGKSDHWDLLASSLGAEPAKSEEGLSQDEPDFPGADSLVEAEDAVEDTCANLPRSAACAPPPARHKSADDWNRLAGQLGVEVPAEPARPLAPAPVVAEAPEVAEVPPVEAEASPVEGGSSWDNLDEPEEKGPDEERERRGRRRRKRRRRSIAELEKAHQDDEGSEPEFPFEREETGEHEEAVEGEVIVTADLDDALCLPEDNEFAEAAPAEVGEGEEARPERRRRRRRKRRPDARGPESEGPVAMPDSRAEEDEATAATEAAETADEHTEELADEESHDDKSLHRAIPTWEEAVGVVISANLESRARNPHRRSSQRPRGHHRGGRSD